MSDGRAVNHVGVWPALNSDAISLEAAAELVSASRRREDGRAVWRTERTEMLYWSLVAVDDAILSLVEELTGPQKKTAQQHRPRGRKGRGTCTAFLLVKVVGGIKKCGSFVKVCSCRLNECVFCDIPTTRNLNGNRPSKKNRRRATTKLLVYIKQ